MRRIFKAAALIIKDKKLLIAKPIGKPFFINPGGKYEEGESPEECLKRELKEELEVDLVSSKHYKTYNIAKAAHSDNPLTLELYFVNYIGQIIPSAEVEMVRWLSKKDFEDSKYNLAPSFQLEIPDLIKDGFL